MSISHRHTSTAQALVSRSRGEGSTGEPRSPCRHTRAGGPTFSSLTVDDLNGRFQPKRLYEASSALRAHPPRPGSAARSSPLFSLLRQPVPAQRPRRRAPALLPGPARAAAPRSERPRHEAAPRGGSACFTAPPRHRAGASGLSARERSPSAE